MPDEEIRKIKKKRTRSKRKKEGRSCKMELGIEKVVIAGNVLKWISRVLVEGKYFNIIVSGESV